MQLYGILYQVVSLSPSTFYFEMKLTGRKGSADSSCEKPKFHGFLFIWKCETYGVWKIPITKAELGQ